MLRARLAITIAVLGCCALAAPAAASADPVPAFGVEWPMCGSAPDDDGLYCIVSRTKNGSPIVVPPSGTYEDPYVQFVGFGSEPKSTVAFGVWLTDLDAGHQDTNVSPDDTYELVVNTGTVKPRELFGNVRNVSFSAGGGPPGGYTFTLSFKPTPVAWLEPFGTCQVGSCGDDTTTATFLRDGFVTGFVTNLVGSGSTRRRSASAPGTRARTTRTTRPCRSATSTRTRSSCGSRTRTCARPGCPRPARTRRSSRIRC